jgi:hypothetical protein
MTINPPSVVDALQKGGVPNGMAEVFAEMYEALNAGAIAFRHPNRSFVDRPRSKSSHASWPRDHKSQDEDSDCEVHARSDARGCRCWNCIRKSMGASRPWLTASAE